MEAGDAVSLYIDLYLFMIWTHLHDPPPLTNKVEPLSNWQALTDEKKGGRTSRDTLPLIKG